MRGYPNTLNTKEDYEYVKEYFSEDEWKKDWQALLDSEKDWFQTGVLPDEKSGVTDDTHKVVAETDDESGETRYLQFELQVIPTCRLNRLGFTEEEVKAALA